MFLLALGLAAAMFQYAVWLRHHSAILEAEVARADRNADEAQRHRLMADRHFHGAQIRLACQALEDGQVERAQDLLHDDDPKPWRRRPQRFRLAIPLAPRHPRDYPDFTAMNGI